MALCHPFWTPTTLYIDKIITKSRAVGNPHFQLAAD